MDSKAWILGSVSLALAIALAEVAWLAESPPEARAGAGRASWLAFLALLIHAVAAPAAAWLAGRFDRRTDAMDRGDGAALVAVGAGVVAALAAAVGAAMLPGPWHAALPISFCGGLTAVILAWTTIPRVRRVDFESAGPGATGMVFPLLMLPTAVAVGGLVRLGLHLGG